MQVFSKFLEGLIFDKLESLAQDRPATYPKLAFRHSCGKTSREKAPGFPRFDDVCALERLRRLGVKSLTFWRLSRSRILVEEGHQPLALLSSVRAGYRVGSRRALQGQASSPWDSFRVSCRRTTCIFECATGQSSAWPPSALCRPNGRPTCRRAGGGTQLDRLSFWFASRCAGS